MNDKNKWEKGGEENKGDGKVGDGVEKKEKEVEGKKGGGNDEPFGKNFDNFVGLD